MQKIYVAKSLVTNNPKSIYGLIWNHNPSSFAMDGMEREESGQPGTVEGGYSYTSPEGELVATFIWTFIWTVLVNSFQNRFSKTQFITTATPVLKANWSAKLELAASNIEIVVIIINHHND